MYAVLETLEANEPTISAVVGLLTIGAAAWGVVQLALLPLLTTRRGAKQANASHEPTTPSLKLWPSLVNRGVDPRADFIAQISGRTLNACLLALVSTALVLLVLALSEDNVATSVCNLFLFLTGIAAYNLHAMGYPAIARWLLILGVTLYWNLNILLMGTMIGLEFCLGGVLILPLLIFEQEQKRQMYAACALIVISLPLALGAEAQLNTSWPFNSVTVPPFYYHGNAVVLAGLVFLSLSFYNRSADASFRQMEDQEQKSAELIHALLPAYIAEKMAKRGANVADWHSEATVLFATVVGFEQLYKRVSAVQLVELLRQVFEEFDDLVQVQGVEKINTLGTNYVAATGIDASREASSEHLARVALGMREVVERLSEAVDHPFGLRIGISTGDVVSGVIGDERPSFDIWGQTVELANTIRGDTGNNVIVVNEAAYWRLRNTFDFTRQVGGDEAYLLQDVAQEITDSQPGM